MLQAGRSLVPVQMRGTFKIDLILPAALWPWGRLASNRNEYQESLKIKNPGGKVRPALKADNLATIC
jgi:hypothetical protein